MKTNTPLRFAIILLISLFTKTVSSQNYNFKLEQNSQYNYTISAVSLYDSGSFQPITQSYGFVLVLPQGFTITVDSAQPSGANETLTSIPGSNVAALDSSMSDKDLFQIITDTSGGVLAAHGNGITIPLVTITVNGNPSSGEIRLLSNFSVLASNPALNGALDAFFQVDVTDDATVNFNNEYNSLEGDEAFNFATLSIDPISEDIDDIFLYPNPVKNIVNIGGSINLLNLIEIFNLNGQLILTQDQALGHIDVSQLESAVYLVKLHTTTTSKTIKLVKTD